VIIGIPRKTIKNEGCNEEGNSMKEKRGETKRKLIRVVQERKSLRGSQLKDCRTRETLFLATHEKILLLSSIYL